MKFKNIGLGYVPHPQKKRGEDWYVIDENILAVADGVGGWAEVGVDSGVYSWDLCQNIKNSYYSDTNWYDENPKKLLVDSTHKTKS